MSSTDGNLQPNLACLQTQMEVRSCKHWHELKNAYSQVDKLKYHHSSCYFYLLILNLGLEQEN